jgi:RND family efflux transporter MFP subunit
MIISLHIFIEVLERNKMNKMIKMSMESFFILLLLISFSYGQEKKGIGMPAAPVIVSEVRTGLVSSVVEFVGTVYYPEVSDVAAESSGRIEAVSFEEGQRVKKGDLLVKINTELLEKTIQGSQAAHEEVLVNLEKAKIDLQRIENLFRKQVVPEQLYDENRYKVQSLEKKAASLMAEVERLQIDLARKSIRSPFDGIVVKRWVDQGEWLQPGSAVATVARDDMVDIVVELPEILMKNIRIGMDVKTRVGGKEMKGKVFAFVPRGDVATRTFPVKIRMSNTLSLIEGMEARVSLPSGESRRTFMVPRDAILPIMERTVIFAVVDSKAKTIPVKVIGYQGEMGGIEGEGLLEGMKVVVKGNERIRDGQMVTILPKEK